MFTTPCFISCTNNEKHMYGICVKLRELGYEGIQNDSMRYVDSAVSYAISNCRRNKLYKPIIKTCPYEFEIHYKTTKRLKGIDCDTNEKLFLAIAALRDDSDYLQWFVCDEPTIINGTQSLCIGSFFRLREDVFACSIKAHKATVEELIEHFTQE